MFPVSQQREERTAGKCTNKMLAKRGEMLASVNNFKKGVGEWRSKGIHWREGRQNTSGSDGKVKIKGVEEVETNGVKERSTINRHTLQRG